MKQKIIWKAFLVIVINIVLLYSCKPRVEQLKTVTYVYKNITEHDLTLEIYNVDNLMFESFDIPSNSNIETNTTQTEGGPVLFYFKSDTNFIGTTIIIRFSDNKCQYFYKNNLDKIFDITKYDNYSEDLLDQNEFTISYTITNQDHDDSVNCNR